MSWTTSVDDMRRLVSDGPTDKLRHRKKVFGQIDGSNVSFKTIEFRRVTDFTSVNAPLGVFVDNVLVSVTSDDIATGEFNLSSAPDNGSTIEATYYSQWFNDDEISGFMQGASDWLLIGDPTQIPSGLRPAALHYGAQLAYQKLALKFAESLSETYRAEDNPNSGSFPIVVAYQKAAMDMHTKSIELRDGYYRRSGQSLQALSSSLVGKVSDPVPKR